MAKCCIICKGLKIAHRWLAIIYLVSLPFITDAQQSGPSKIDSLKTALKLTSTDSARVILLNQISFEYYLANPDSGIVYANKALEIAEELHWAKSIASCYSRLGTNYKMKSNPPQALDYYFKALKIYEGLKDKGEISNNLSNIGSLYGDQHNIAKALEYDSLALKIDRELGNKSSIAKNLSNMGILYFNQNDLYNGLKYELQAKQIYQETADELGTSIVFSNLGSIYQKMGNYAEALGNISQALDLSLKMGDSDGVAVNYGDMGDIYLAEAKDSAQLIAGPNIPNTRKEVLQLAVKYLELNHDLSRRLGNSDMELTFYPALAEAYMLNGNNEKALHTYRDLINLKDTEFAKESSIKVANLEAEWNKQKQTEKEKIAAENKKRERILFIAGICLLLVVVVKEYRNNITQKKLNNDLGEEKKRSDDLLLNILPAEVAEELKNKGSAKAKEYNEVTVLLTDFVNFTKAGERLGAQELVTELDACFKEFDHIIGKYNIEKIKTIGDAYLAVSGLPRPTGDHAKNMVHAAIEIGDYMRARYAANGDRTFEIRIGVHSGSVVAGIVGVKKFAYDIWGDTVNTAARMEQHSEPGCINISAATYELVKDDFDCQYRSEIEAKNKGAMKMYFVKCAKSSKPDELDNP